MASSTSRRAVVTALVGNAFVTAIKFIAFVLSGSGAMLSESIHSVADTGNQLLLLVGLRRGERAPDDRFPYGYGGERFVFGILSAAGIFFIGSGITVYHGVTSLLDPHMPQLTAVTFGVLGMALLIEGSVLVAVVHTLNKQRGATPFVAYVRKQADPATLAILLEDGAAVLGVLLASAGIAAAYLTGNPMWDAMASLIVGLLLGVVALHLVRENRELLLGRAVPEGVEERFTHVVLHQPSVRSVRDIKTRQLTPEAYLFKAEITLDPDYVSEALGRALPQGAYVPRVENPMSASEEVARSRQLRRFATAATELIATEIAAIEAAIRAAIPQAKHIDLELAHPDKPDDDEELA